MHNTSLTISISIIIFAIYGITAKINQPPASRNVIQLGEAINCVENSTLVEALFKYYGYGCWCGLGGGGKPVDEIDRCCMNHDYCYERCRKSPKFLICIPHVATYDWKCEHKFYKTACMDQPGTCKRCACDCDMKIVNCFHVHADAYRKGTQCKKSKRPEPLFVPEWLTNTAKIKKRIGKQVDENKEEEETKQKKTKIAVDDENQEDDDDDGNNDEDGDDDDYEDDDGDDNDKAEDGNDDDHDDDDYSDYDDICDEHDDNGDNNNEDDD